MTILNVSFLHTITKIPHSTQFEIYGKNLNRQQDSLACPLMIMDEMDGLKQHLFIYLKNDNISGIVEETGEVDFSTINIRNQVVTSGYTKTQ